MDATAVVRLGLELTLAGAGHEVVAVASEAELEARTSARLPDVTVIDLYLSGPAAPPAIDLVRRLSVAGHRVLVHPAQSFGLDVVNAVAAGAAAVLARGPTTEPLVELVDKLLVWRPEDGPIVTAELARAAERRDRFGLTSSESEVLHLVAEHLTNAEIAQRRFVTEETVKTQLASIRRKLGAATRADAVRMARQQGLLGHWNLASGS